LISNMARGAVKRDRKSKPTNEKGEVKMEK
jgi:hypothetical protein